MGTRRFSVISVRSSEILALNITDLQKMQLEFPDAANDLFEIHMAQLPLLIKRKMRLIKFKEGNDVFFQKEESFSHDSI